MSTPSKKFQFVWWGWEKAFAPPGFVVYQKHEFGGMALTYRWSIWIGPLEIRRWTTLEHERWWISWLGYLAACLGRSAPRIPLLSPEYIDFKREQLGMPPITRRKPPVVIKEKKIVRFLDSAMDRLFGKVRYKTQPHGGPWCIHSTLDGAMDDVEGFHEAHDDFTITTVRMTTKELLALPEFQGY